MTSRPMRARDIFALSHMFGITWILTHLSRFYALHKSTKRRGHWPCLERDEIYPHFYFPFYYSTRRHLVWWSYVWISNLYKWDRYFCIKKTHLWHRNSFKLSKYFQENFSTFHKKENNVGYLLVKLDIYVSLAFFL